MWAGVWFPSVAHSRLWSLYASYPLCSLKRRNAQHIPLAFLWDKKKKKKNFFFDEGVFVVNFMLIWKCLLDYIRGILLLYPNLIVCLAVRNKSEFRKSLIWISKPPNGKISDGKWTESALPFHHSLPVGMVFHLRQLQQSKAVTTTRLLLYC